MNVIVRIQRQFFAEILTDLRRPHPVAFERAGFLFAKRAEASPSDRLLFPVEYRSIEDRNYLEDGSAGATFNTAAIRAAMQVCRTTGLSCLQVHAHEHEGVPHFSQIDCKTIDELSESFRVVAPGQVHGGLVFSLDHVTARVWTPTGERLAQGRVSIVGFPFCLGPVVQ